MSEYFKDEFKKDIYNNTHSIPSPSLRYPFPPCFFFLLPQRRSILLHPRKTNPYGRELCQTTTAS
jgi:hypothetical protein